MPVTDWASNLIYGVGDLVLSAGAQWQSLQNGNLNHRPEDGASIGWWLLFGPREQVLAAFQSIVATGLALPVERNAPEPASMVETPRRLIQLDGEEDEPEKEHDVGVRVHKCGVELECYVVTPDQDPGPVLNDLLERARATILRERDIDGSEGRPYSNRVLGSLLYGNVHDSYGHPEFEGLEEGKTRIEIYRQSGAEHGAVGILEWILHYAVAPDAPWILLRPGEGDR
jgi:hypothetical protein